MTDINGGWRIPDKFFGYDRVLDIQSGGGQPRRSGTTFKRALGGMLIALSGEIDARLHQREDDAVRAIGRVCVAAGHRFAKAMSEGRIEPKLDFQILRSGNAEWTIEFALIEFNGPYERRSQVFFEQITANEHARPDITPADIRGAASAIKKLAEDLHGALG